MNLPPPADDRSFSAGDLDRVLALAAPRGGERVLDLSGRAGTLGLRAADAAASVEVMQRDAELTEEGRRLARSLGYQNLYFHTGRPDHLPFDDGQFDLAFWCLGLSREPQPLACLAEAGRVLAPSGRLVLQEVVAFEAAALDLKVWELERRRDPAFLLFYREEEVCTMARLGGFALAHEDRTAMTQDFDYWADTLGRDRPGGQKELEELKRFFFTLPPPDQDRMDLALADGRISFVYPLLTLVLTPA